MDPIPDAVEDVHLYYDLYISPPPAHLRCPFGAEGAFGPGTFDLRSPSAVNKRLKTPMFFDTQPFPVRSNSNILYLMLYEAITRNEYALAKYIKRMDRRCRSGVNWRQYKFFKRRYGHPNSAKMVELIIRNREKVKDQT